MEIGRNTAVAHGSVFADIYRLIERLAVEHQIFDVLIL